MNCKLTFKKLSIDDDKTIVETNYEPQIGYVQHH